jgi:hypothetical protein
MSWSEPSAGISGADGYAFLWDRFPVSLPPVVVNASAEVVRTTGPQLADGTDWYFHMRVRDRAGNWALDAVHSGPYWVDSTGPVITGLMLNGGAETALCRTVRASVQASDAPGGSGLGQIRWKVNAGSWGGWERFSENRTFDLDAGAGPYAISAQVRDLANNTSPEIKSTITLPRPVVVLLLPAANSTVRGTFAVVGTSSQARTDLKVVQVEVRLDNGDWRPARGTDSWTCNFDSTALKNGRHAIYARAFDGSGYSADAMIEVRVDNETPATLAGMPLLVVVVVVMLAGLTAAYMITARRRKRPAMPTPPGPYATTAQAPLARPRTPEEERMLRQGRVLQAISTLPNGLPSSLWNIPQSDLAMRIVDAERMDGPSGELLLRIDNRWYYGDETNPSTFMKEYRSG